MMSDGELVRQALNGRTEAYGDLVRRWAGRITALCHAKIGRADVAEDMAQETLMRGYRALSSLAEPDKFGSWLCGIAVRACFDWLKAKERSQVTFSALSPDGNPASSVPNRPDACDATEDRAEELAQLLAAVLEQRVAAEFLDEAVGELVRRLPAPPRLDAGDDQQNRALARLAQVPLRVEKRLA